MKILLLTDGMYPYVLGGMQKHSYYMAKYLARNQVMVHVVHCVTQGEVPEDQGANHRYFHWDELKNMQFTCIKWPKTDPFIGHYVRENKRYSDQIFELVKEDINQFDLIYAQGFSGWRFIQERKNGMIPIPVMVNFHGFEMYQKAPSFKAKLQHIILKRPARWNILHADYVSSFGGMITDIIKLLGVPNDKIIELPIGIESSWINDFTSEPADTSNTRKFVFIGRYERRKGIEELSQVLKELLADDSMKFEFHFIGPIPESKQISDKSIIYHGTIIDQHRIQEILEECDILVCPSHSEGMPTVILEGMAMGLAIIATKVGAIEKLIRGNGWLIESTDKKLLLDTLIKAIRLDSAQLNIYKQLSVELIRKNYLWEKVIQLMIAEFKNIIERR